MNYPEYAESIRNVKSPEGLKFRQAVAWLHPENLPVLLASVGDTAQTVIRVPAQAENRFGRTVPVIALAADAFAGNERVKDIILPAGIEELPAGAFAGCVRLRNITVPKKVRTIGEGAFAGCTGLQNIYYEGTPEEWRSVRIVCRKHEIELGPPIPGTPVQSILAERELHIPGNEAVFSANIHFRCQL